MSVNVLIIDGHPDPSQDRLCHALAEAYAHGAAAAGNPVRRLDVARLDFSMLRTRTEFETETTQSDIQAAQTDIEWARHLVIVYPLWLGTMPALLKGFLEQCLRPGFAFEKDSKGWPKKLLRARSARIVVTMGMPAFWYRWFYLAHSLRSLERNILKFCGITPVRETLFGMVEAASESKRAKWLAEMERLGRAAA